MMQVSLCPSPGPGHPELLLLAVSFPALSHAEEERLGRDPERIFLQFSSI